MTCFATLRPTIGFEVSRGRRYVFGSGVCSTESGRQTDHLYRVVAGTTDRPSPGPIGIVYFIGRAEKLAQRRGREDQGVKLFVVPKLGEIESYRPSDLVTPVLHTLDVRKSTPRSIAT